VKFARQKRAFCLSIAARASGQPREFFARVGDDEVAHWRRHRQLDFSSCIVEAAAETI
jgi:hypothetical protein